MYFDTDDIDIKNIIYAVLSIGLFVYISCITKARVNIIEEFTAAFFLDNSIEDFLDSQDKFIFYFQSILALMEFSLINHIVKNILDDEGIFNRLADFIGSFFCQLALVTLSFSIDEEALAIISVITPIAFINPALYFTGGFMVFIALAILLDMFRLDGESIVKDLLSFLWNAAITQIIIRLIASEAIVIIIFAFLFRAIIIPNVSPYLPAQVILLISLLLSISLTKIKEFVTERLDIFGEYEDEYNWTCGIFVSILIIYCITRIG